MDCYTKQRYSGFKPGAGTPKWGSVMGLDTSVSPGTVIRPDMPLGSGPAKSAKMPSASQPVDQQEMPADPKPVKQQEMPVMPMRCPCVSSGTMPVKCPEKHEEYKPETVRCPEKPTGTMPRDTAPSYKYRKCPSMHESPVLGERFDKFPLGMAYVPWQQWGQIYPIEEAIYRGTIFPDLNLPFLMGGCRR